MNYIIEKRRAANPAERNIGKTAFNVINALHACLDFAWRSEKIPKMPAFPKKEEYNMVDPVHNWLSEQDQLAIINAMSEADQPIFLWLKYHYHRPSEACVLKWSDYDQVNNAFMVWRGLSARKVVDSTKTGVDSEVPCDPDFFPVLMKLKASWSGNLNEYIFQNPRARKDGRYTLESLKVVLRNACKKLGIPHIKVYEFTKHSSCDQYLNEKGGNVDELQILTGHKRRESVLKYAKPKLSAKRRLMMKGREGKVIVLDTASELRQKEEPVNFSI
jgi:integrase